MLYFWDIHAEKCVKNDRNDPLGRRPDPAANKKTIRDLTVKCKIK